MNTVLKSDNQDIIQVSVIVLTYNHEKYIEQCLNAILNQQTNFNFEIIVGEDESSDGTRDICQRYAKQHPDKIRLFLRSRKDVIYINGKATGRYNFIKNFEEAKGKYIALCEGDDYWTDPLKLQKQVDFLEANKDYVACFHPCEILRMKENPHTITKQQLDAIKYDYSINNILTHWNIPTASLVIRNDFKLPDWFKEVASGDIALLMINYNKGKFKLLEDYMSVYRLTGKGVSESHRRFRMIHYRANLYTHLNEYYNYEYEEDIYDALFKIYLKYKPAPLKEKKPKSIFQKVLSKISQIVS